MKSCRRTYKSGLVSPRVMAGILGLAILPLVGFAAAPSWWSARGILKPGAQPNDYAPINQGQLKNIAKAAAAELDAQLPGGAGDVVHNLVASWTSNANTNDF